MLTERRLGYKEEKKCSIESILPFQESAIVKRLGGKYNNSGASEISQRLQEI